MHVEHTRILTDTLLQQLSQYVHVRDLKFLAVSVNVSLKKDHHADINVKKLNLKDLPIQVHYICCEYC